MSQYAKLKAQIADLQAQADDVRRQEVAAVIAEVQQKIAEYGLTARDLGFAERAKRGRPPKKRRCPEIPRSEVGRDWSGRGKPPNGSSVKPRSFPHRMTESQTKSRIEMRLFYYPRQFRRGLDYGIFPCGIPCQAPATRRNAG